MKRLRNLQACLTETQRRADKGFVLDSGATRTLVKQRAWLGRLMHRLKLTVRDAAGGCHDTQGTGDLTVRFLQKDGKFRSLGDIGQATLVEGLMYNLLSVSQLCRYGFEVVFKRHGSRIVTPDGVVIPVHDDNGLYFAPTYSLPTETRAKGSKLREVVCSDSDMVMERTSTRRFYSNLISDKRVQHALLGELESYSGAFRENPGRKYWRDTKSIVGARNAAAGWHRVHRLAGHPSREVTDGMVRSGKFGRIAMPDERDKFCEVCARAAFTRPPVIKSGLPRTTRVGKRWHADLAGPFKRDRKGIKYAMNIVDDATGTSTPRD